MVKQKKIAVGISGGVDSAVSAALLKKQGYEVIGVHLYCYDDNPACTADEDRASAVRAARHLGISLKVWDLRREYKKWVIDYFFAEYKAGRTPNPDIACNNEIKFGVFLQKAFKELDVSYIATGHYARIERDKSGYHLLKGVDEGKDQSYFLYGLTQARLEHILFPIGGLTKAKVRKIAGDLELPNKDRPDSQGICFIGPIDVGEFLREQLPTIKGPVANTKGEVIGEHDGAWFFTEGQRRGFHIFKPGLPLYVIKKDISINTLVVGRGTDSKVKTFEVGALHWITGEKLKDGQKTKVRIRHLGDVMDARVKYQDEDILEVALSSATRGVAPGQSAVFYKGDEVLGGGVIAAI